MSSEHSITLIVPCFNESKRLNFEYFVKIMESKKIKLVFVNDGSTDDTQTMLNDFCQESYAELINLNENLGKAEAVRQGILRISQESTKFIGFLDCDGAFSLNDIETVSTFALNCKSGEEYFWTSRVMLAGSNIERNWLRHYVGRIIVTLMSFGIENCPYDTQSGFKIFTNNDANKKLFVKKFKTKWLFDIEIVLRIHSMKKAHLIKEIPLHAWKDIDGSKLNVTEALNILKDCIKIFQLRVKS